MVKSIIFLAALAVVSFFEVQSEIQMDPWTASKNQQVLASNVEELDGRTYRLPNNTAPTHYNVRLSTEIHRGDFSVQGIVRINIRVLEPSNSITLHIRQLIIERIMLFNIDGSPLATDLNFTFDSDLEFLVITTSSQLSVDQELIVDITFAGFLNIDTNGFFRIAFVDPETTQLTWLATTSTQPIHTRRVFPCYDEVRFRTTYQLSIYHHNSYNAISNMPVASQETQGDYVTTTFEQTPPIPTYILHFTVSNFAFTSNNDHPNVPIRVFARPAAIAADQADNAAELAVTFLTLVESMFNRTFALPKSDLIALPGGAITHNWGLITLPQNLLLRITDLPIAQHQRELWVAHAYAHIFFANLVSISSWSYVWLNEGFARLYENILNDIVFPEKNQWEEFMIDTFDAAINVDVDGNVDTLNRWVDSPADTQSRWNFITFNKAAIILRMFMEALTAETYHKGIESYIEEMQMQSATPDDLAAGLQRAFDEDFPGNDLDIQQMMHPWLNLGGYPVVTVMRNSQGLVLTQRTFRQVHDELFNIPITYATATHSSYDSTVPEFWMTTPEMSIARDEVEKTWNDDDWIILNIRDTAYFVTNYDEVSWQLIINALMDDHEAIHFINRGTLFADFHRFILHAYDDVRTSWYLEMIRALPLEHHQHVWIRAAPGFATLEQRLRGSDLHTMFLSLMRDIMSSVYGTRTFNAAAMDAINTWSCLSGVQECLDDSLNALVDVMVTGSTTFPFAFRCNGFMSANETVWNHFFSEAMSLPAGSAARATALSDLLCTNAEGFIWSYLNAAVDFTNNLSQFERVTMISQACSRNSATYEVSIDFVTQNHQVLNQLAHVGAFAAPLARATNTECNAERVFSLVRLFPEPATNDRQLLFEMLAPNLEFYWRNFVDFHNWFESYESGKFVK